MNKKQMLSAMMMAGALVGCDGSLRLATAELRAPIERSPSTGYLYVEVSSHFDQVDSGLLRRAIGEGYSHCAFFVEFERPDPAGGPVQTVEIPVALSDLTQARVVDVTQHRLVLPEAYSGHASVKFRVRGIRSNIARAFQDAWNEVDRIMQANSLSQLLTGTQFASALGVMRGIVTAANQPNQQGWSAERRFDVAANSQLAPNRRPIAFFLRRTGQPDPTRLSLCPNGVNVCAGNTRLSGEPYVVVRAGLVAYRPLREFAPVARWTPTLTSATSASFSRLSDALENASLTPAQRVCEEAMLHRLELAREIRALSGRQLVPAEIMRAMGDLATKYINLGAPDSPLWSEYYAQDAATLKQAIDAAIRVHGATAPLYGRLWDVLPTAVRASSQWGALNLSSRVTPLDDSEAAGAEALLTLVRRPLLVAGDQATAALPELARVEHSINDALLPYYRQLRTDCATVTDATRGALSQRVQAHSNTQCEECRVEVDRARELLRPPPAPEQPTAVNPSAVAVQTPAQTPTQGSPSSENTPQTPTQTPPQAPTQVTEPAQPTEPDTRVASR